MIRQLCSASRTRSSAHLGPIDGSGRECGIDSRSPACSRPSNRPASIRPLEVNGGVLTRPCNQTTGLRCAFSSTGIIYRMRYVGNLRPRQGGTLQVPRTQAQILFLTCWRQTALFLTCGIKVRGNIQLAIGRAWAISSARACRTWCARSVETPIVSPWSVMNSTSYPRPSSHVSTTSSRS